jgi:hypothetical protein
MHPLSTDTSTERQLSDLNPSSPAQSLHSPMIESNLHTSIPAVSNRPTPVNADVSEPAAPSGAPTSTTAS